MRDFLTLSGEFTKAEKDLVGSRGAMYSIHERLRQSNEAIRGRNLLGQAAQGQMGLAGAQQGAAAQNANLFGTAGQLQQGLAALQPQLAQQTFASLGQVGTGQQAQIQAGIDTANQAAQMAAFEPQQRLQQYGAGLGQLAGFGAQAPQLPTGGEPSALDKALGTALGVGGLYAKIFAKPQVVIR